MDFWTVLGNLLSLFCIAYRRQAFSFAIILKRAHEAALDGGDAIISLDRSDWAKDRSAKSLRSFGRWPQDSDREQNWPRTEVDVDPLILLKFLDPLGADQSHQCFIGTSSKHPTANFHVIIL